MPVQRRCDFLDCLITPTNPDVTEDGVLVEYAGLRVRLTLDSYNGKEDPIICSLCAQRAAGGTVRIVVPKEEA